MDADYLRALSIRCAAIARDCFDRRAADELRRLASEFATKAAELEPRVFAQGEDHGEEKDRV